MSGIICAVRGGAASQPTINQAIRTALETGLPIYFLYVVNLDFLMRTDHIRVHTITEEMREMGEFILLTAQDKAAAQGVAAHGVIREGNVADEIVALCREMAAEYAILGQPRAVQAQNVFTDDLLDTFSQRIMQEAGTAVIFAAGSTS
ncbi:MAG: universal stress protein [Ardenticatenaceae bacterium]|nr:universal stress protein [Anaerolineales bacterium]MCB8923582.1 universal stress protein [Ardenticatenaceae bacterium]MCB9003522.1 universal stress protein [Ardenticatenaceae bacterium]